MHDDPIPSMYGIFTYMKTHKINENVGKYTIPMDGMGMFRICFSLLGPTTRTRMEACCCSAGIY